MTLAPDTRCDIFCTVVDNYGDIGVTWRLARILAQDHGLAVRLWVDDLASYVKLCPQADVNADTQLQMGVTVCRWQAELPNPEPADLVIAAFACKLPEGYVAAMATRSPHSVWINLEYLSAEDWVHGCHGLPSPHPRLPLSKYFFFPGFTAQTGGLLLERGLLARRDAFLADPAAQRRYWEGLGMTMPSADTLKVSLFAYENEALEGLFDLWAAGSQAVLCLAPEGRILPQVQRYFASTGRTHTRGNLEVRVLPFVAQQDYDPLLWACDINFVRGEDSCVRAQWAGKPFIWQIYPQQDEVHWEKLDAFLQRYLAGLEPGVAQAVSALWRAWNSGSAAAAGWPGFSAVRGLLGEHALAWSGCLAQNDLALNLLDFCQKVGRMRAFEIEGSEHEDSTRITRR